MARIVVPTPNTTITSVWGTSVANALNDMWWQTGLHTGLTNGNGDTTITFGTAFAAPPPIVLLAPAMPGLNTGPLTNIQAIGTTQCTYRLYRADTGGIWANTQLSMLWMACGPRV